MSGSVLTGVPLPQFEGAVTAVEPPDAGPGYWAGAPSAVFVDGIYYLAYRLRRPVGKGRGYAVVVASSRNGVEFEPLTVLEQDEFGTESLERPALVPLPGEGWRLYVSCATPGTLHWWVCALDAKRPDQFRAKRRRMVLPGDATTAVKDPVVMWQGGQWHLWGCCHPLPDAGEADRMTTRYATSRDGLRWSWKGIAMSGRPGAWDERGARITSVVHGPAGLVAYYDGRASAAENFFERTGLAIADGPGTFRSISETPEATSPEGDGAVRYVSAVPLPDGGYRLYYEASRADGAHHLRTERVPPPR